MTDVPLLSFVLCLTCEDLNKGQAPCQILAPSIPFMLQAFLTASYGFEAGADKSKGCAPSILEASDQLLPSDWRALSQATGLRSFSAVPIMDGPSIVGQLTVGSHQDVEADCDG